MSTTTDGATDLRGAMTRLLEWLNSHPQIRPLCVDYADGSEVEQLRGLVDTADTAVGA